MKHLFSVLILQFFLTGTYSQNDTLIEAFKFEVKQNNVYGIESFDNIIWTSSNNSMSVYRYSESGGYLDSVFIGNYNNLRFSINKNTLWFIERVNLKDNKVYLFDLIEKKIKDSISFEYNQTKYFPEDICVHMNKLYITFSSGEKSTKIYPYITLLQIEPDTKNVKFYYSPYSYQLISSYRDTLWASIGGSLFPLDFKDSIVSHTLSRKIFIKDGADDLSMMGNNLWASHRFTKSVRKLSLQNNITLNTVPIINSICVYPNPGNGLVYIKGLNSFKKYQINIIDITGKTAKYNTFESGVHIRTPGVYKLNITEKDKILFSKKIIINHDFR